MREIELFNRYNIRFVSEATKHHACEFVKSKNAHAVVSRLPSRIYDLEEFTTMVFSLALR